MSGRVYLLAIAAVALALILSIVGIVILALNQLTVPDVLQNIAVGSLTGLVGLLVTPSPQGVDPVFSEK